MHMFQNLIDKLKAHPRKIVFTEGTDPRILEASARLLSGTFLTPVLVGNEEEVQAAAEKAGFNIRGAIIIDPENYDGMDAMVEKMVELRKGKMTADECRAALKKGNYFGTMLVKMGVADALLGGATYSTADTVRPALQLVKTKPGNKIVSSCFILVRASATGDNDVLAMGDCAINIKPEEDELVEIAVETAKCAKIFGIAPKVAFLSYSTKGSGKGEDVDKMRNACEKAKALMPDIPVDGEMQFDAAVSPTVGQLKFPCPLTRRKTAGPIGARRFASCEGTGKKRQAHGRCGFIKSFRGPVPLFKMPTLKGLGKKRRIFSLCVAFSLRVRYDNKSAFSQF